MLPDFGYALYVEFDDNSKTLAAWASDRNPLEDAAPTFVRALSDEVKAWEIVAAHRVAITQTGDLPYELVISDLEPQPASYAGRSAQRR